MSMAMWIILTGEEEMPMAVRWEGHNYGEGGSNTSISRLWERWWGGLDPGQEVTVQINMRIPAWRNTEEFAALMQALMESGLDGGHGNIMTIHSPVSGAGVTSP